MSQVQAEILVDAMKAVEEMVEADQDALALQSYRGIAKLLLTHLRGQNTDVLWEKLRQTSHLFRIYQEAKNKEEEDEDEDEEEEAEAEQEC